MQEIWRRMQEPLPLLGASLDALPDLGLTLALVFLVRPSRQAHACPCFYSLREVCVCSGNDMQAREARKRRGSKQTRTRY